TGSHNNWTAKTILGDTSIDRWVFNNSYGYSVPTPLSGKVAIADAYNGGYVNTGSNNTNQQELVLQSPTVSTVGLTNLRLTYNQLYMQLNASTIYVEVSTNGGSTWTTALSSTVGGFFGNSQSLDLGTY